MLDLPFCFKRIFNRTRSFHCREYLVSSPTQKLLEKSWCLARPSVQARRRLIDSSQDRWDDEPDSWAAHLSITERERLQKYLVRFSKHAVLLSQNPDEFPVYSKFGVLPTLMHRGGIIYMEGEIFTCKDLWRSMGFPIADDEVAASHAACQFSDGRAGPAARTPGLRRLPSVVIPCT
jgi:hypothetical protein